MKPTSAKPAPGHHRCLYLSATGRKCRNWVLDSRAMFCPRHMQAQPNGPDDFSLHLLHRACNFQNAEGIHDSLRQLYTLLASDAISPRRAAVLGYLTSLLLRTLPAVYNDPLPLAGTLMSAAQLAERDKAKSLPTRASQPASPAPSKKPAPTQVPMPAQQVAPTDTPTPGRALTNKIVPQSSAQPTAQAPVHSTPSANAAPTGDYLDCGPGRPLPATRAEFAAQVLKSVVSTPPPPTPATSNLSTPTPQISTKPNPPAIAATATNPPAEQLKSLEPAPGKAPPEPANPPPFKKPYQVRLHINMPITGSPPPWGWTTDP
jgi:hypothetical protein